MQPRGRTAVVTSWGATRFGWAAATSCAEPPFAILPAGDDTVIPSRLHLAFAATSRDQVDRFHAAAIATGGSDDGPPGIRHDYNAGYYAAFVRDPDGHRLEVVLHERQPD